MWTFLTTHILEQTNLPKQRWGRRTEHASLKTHSRDPESFNTWKTANWRHPSREEDQGGLGETVLVLAMGGGKTHRGNKGTVVIKTLV